MHAFSPPAFSIIDEGAINNDPRAVQKAHPEMPVWQSQYATNVSGTENPLLDFTMNHMVQDYQMPNLDSPVPIMPQSYGEEILHNGAVAKNNIKWNLPATPPAPLPTYNQIPYMNPPYGTPYPTNGYSQFDGIYADQAGISQFYGGPGVPAASWPAMLDARDSPSVPMGPNTVAIVAEKRYQQGFSDGKESFAQSYQPTCPQSIGHILNCPLCSHYVNSSKKMYQGGIIILAVIVLILLLILNRRGHVAPPK